MRAAVILLASVLAMGCASEEPREGEQSPASSGLEREIRGFTMSETQGGTPLWELRAEVAYRLPSQSTVRLNDVRVDFFDGEGNLSSWLTARSGIVDEGTEDLTAKGRVIMISLEGDTLITEELRYLREEDRITGPDWVRLSKTDRVITGYGFESSPDLSDYRLERDVHVSFIDRERDPNRDP